MIRIQEVEHPFDEKDVCEFKELWHDLYHNSNDLPDIEHGSVISCLVRRWKPGGDKDKLETILDHFYVKEKTFENTPVKRVDKWCYIEDIEPNQDRDEKFKVLKRDDFFYSVINIKDNFDEYFEELDKRGEEYQLVYNTFEDYEEDLFFIGRSSIPIEDLRWWGFHNYLHLYVVRFGNNGQTLLVSRNRLLLELAIGMDNKTRLLKIR